MWVNLENEIAISDDDMFKLILEEAKRINDVTKEPVMNIVRRIYVEKINGNFVNIIDGIE